jgi:hypothetical protein
VFKEYENYNIKSRSMMEDYEYIQNMPIVRNLKVKNKKLRTKNKDLKKKNKELSKLVKLVFNNLEILQSSSKEINDRIQSNVEIKKEPTVSGKESENTRITLNTVPKTCVECDDIIPMTSCYSVHSQHGLCYKCYSTRDCSKPSHIKIKEENVDNEVAIVKESDIATKEIEEYSLVEEDDELEEEEEEGDNGGDSPVEEDGEDSATEEEEGGNSDDSPAKEEDNGGDSPAKEEDNGGDSTAEEEDNGGDSTAEEEDNGGDSPVEVDDEDEEEVEEVTIEGKMYYTTNKVDGLIYGIDEDGEISVEVGRFSKGKPKFYKK